MPTNYSGNPSNVTTPLTATIIGAANNGAGLIRIQTSAAHLYATYDTVTISGVVGATQANGTWAITVIDGTHFDLVGSAFSSAYVSGGTASDQSLTPYFSTPNDGEPGTVAGILASIQAIADRTQYLAAKAAPPTVFTSSGTWVCPPGVHVAILYGYGGGGAGGNGENGTTSTSTSAPGGAGGGGSVASLVEVPVTPGTSYAVVIGAGGVVTAGYGGPGGNTSFGNVVFRGAQGGSLGLLGTVPTVPGDPLSATAPVSIVSQLSVSGIIGLFPGCGGSAGNNVTASRPGMHAFASGGETGGAAGAAGGVGTVGVGGGGGGGGGTASNVDATAGSAGVGGLGGDGIGGASSYLGNNGTAGSHGCGGGGGGGAGSGTGFPVGDYRGIGGSGGAGKLTIWVR